MFALSCELIIVLTINETKVSLLLFTLDPHEFLLRLWQICNNCRRGNHRFAKNNDKTMEAILKAFKYLLFCPWYNITSFLIILQLPLLFFCFHVIQSKQQLIWVLIDLLPLNWLIRLILSILQIMNVCSYGQIVTLSCRPLQMKL